jgi:DNA-binding response OmpR family regulator
MKRILIVDDEPHMTRVLKLHLERGGYQVILCPNGKEALGVIRAAPPDAMITDIQMPVMTGKELCQTLHAEMPERQFPIFVMTSMTDRDHREWVTRIERLEFLEKPLSMRILTLKLDKYFNSLVSPQAS